jgi:thiol-disulfide isomerase/thioredoxin
MSALALAAALALGAGPGAALGVEASAPAPAPRVTALDLDGRPAELAQHPGEVLVVAFWATWCDACRAELPGLVALGRALARRHPGRFRIVGVSMDEERAAVRRYLRASPRRAGHPGWTVVVDGGDQAALAAYFTAARGAAVPDEYQLPQAYVVGPDGRLVGWVEGPRDWASPAARAYLEEVLRAASAGGA